MEVVLPLHTMNGKEMYSMVKRAGHEDFGHGSRDAPNRSAESRMNIA